MVCNRIPAIAGAAAAALSLASVASADTHHLTLSTNATVSGRNLQQWNWCMTDGPDDGSANQDIGDGGAKYCGGDQVTVNQLSCTPFAFMPHTSQYGGCATTGCSDQEDGAKAKWKSEIQTQGTNAPWHPAGFSMYTGGRFSAKAWYATGQEWYVVFHGCDGAGIQSSDCHGDIFYFEIFGIL